MRATTFLLAICLLTTPYLSSADDAIDLRKQVIFDQKKLNVMQNLPLDKQEAERFWPAYADLQEKLFALELDRSELVSFYATNYKYLTDQQTKEMINAMFQIAENRQLLLKEFSVVLQMKNILPAKKTFRYLQIEQNIAALEQYDLVRRMPLLP